MKEKSLKRILVFATVLLCSALFCTGVVYADTDGTELQVAQPSTLEIQMGPSWAGMEFTLRTDAGTYPDIITVDETGVLRMEIGGSKQYILSCLSSNGTVQIPEENEKVPTATESAENEYSEVAFSNTQQPGQNKKTEPQTTDKTNIAGIPVQHIVFFSGGLVLAVGALVVLHVVKRHRVKNAPQDYDEDEEY